MIMIRRMQDADPTFFLYFQLVVPLAKVRRVHETRDYAGVMSMGDRPPASGGKRCGGTGRPRRVKVGGSVGGLQVTVQPLPEAA